MTRRIPVLAIAVIAALVGTAAAQTAAKPTMQDDRGITSYVEFGGTSDSDGQAYELNSNVGYDFSPHFGFAVGAPFYFVSPSPTPAGTSTSRVGNPPLSLHLKYPRPALHSSSALTGTGPLEERRKR